MFIFFYVVLSFIYLTRVYFFPLTLVLTLKSILQLLSALKPNNNDWHAGLPT